jgi:hypothetical protein
MMTSGDHDYSHEWCFMRRPQGFNRFIKRQGFHSIYLIAGEGSAVKIGISVNPLSLLSGLQHAGIEPLRLHRFWWLAGRAISSRIERSFKERFASSNIRGAWFDMPLAEAEAFIDLSIRTIGTWGITDAEMIDLMDHFERHKYSLPPNAPSPLRGMPQRSECNACDN